MPSGKCRRMFSAYKKMVSAGLGGTIYPTAIQSSDETKFQGNQI